MKTPKIGSIVFVINKKSKQHASLGVKLLTAKITGYTLLNKKVVPILHRGKVEISPEHNEIFYELDNAIAHLKSLK